MKIIDLSQPLTNQTPVYPGDPKLSVEPAGVLANDGYADSVVSIGTHVGTHIDAPAHMLEDGATLADISMDQFIGRGVHIDALDGAFSLSRVKAAGIEAGDIVVFETGWSQRYHDEEYFTHHATIPKDICNYLVEQKVAMVGVDACSPDNDEEFSAHKTLLAGDVLIIENLTNLDVLRDQRFRIIALPIALQFDGAPARVIAELDG